MAEASEIERVHCRSCRFGVLVPVSYFRDCPGAVSEPEHVLCHFEPRILKTKPDHWCGQGQENPNV